MASRLSSNSSTSEEDIKDERKRKRMQSNRESARRSRMRKQQHLDDLINQVSQIKNENDQILMQINLLTQQYIKMESENTILRTQEMELRERLQSVNSMLRLVEGFSGMPMDIPEMPDLLLNPWQLPCLAQPIMASANMFQC